MFIGFGVNAAENSSFLDYQVHDFKEIQVLPNGLPHEIVVAAKNNFRHWIIGNGLTELLHSYSLFLDEVYNAGLWLIKVRKSEDLNYIRPRVSLFRNKTSIASKLRTIFEELGFESQFRSHFHGFAKARNALVHANGRVLQQHCSDAAQSHLEIAWPGFDFITRSPQGMEYECRPGIVVEAGSEILMRTVKRERTFHIGTTIELTPTDINEICFMVSRDARELVDGLTPVAKAAGVRVEPQQA